MYIYIKWKLRNWGTWGFLKAKKFICMWRSPLRPCSIFLAMKGFIKVLFGTGNGASLPCNQIPAKMNLAQPWHGWEWQARGQDRPRVEALHCYQACSQQLQPDTSQTHCRSSAPLARVALGCLALPCLCCLVATGAWLRNWGAGFLSYVLNWTLKGRRGDVTG